MKAHNGMRPQDIVVLLKIVVTPKKDWQYRDLGSSLYLSVSEISESLHRSRIAGLIDDIKRNVHRQSLMEFIRYGLKYVFPQLPGTLVTGIRTAHSHPDFNKIFKGEINYVWPDLTGDTRGLAIQPLYNKVVNAALEDELLYKLLACIDVIRVGQTREIKMALDELQNVIL